MTSSLRSRLLFSYLLLILILLLGFAVGFIWSSIKNPIFYRQSYQQLTLASEWVSSRISVEEEKPTDSLEKTLKREAINRRIRIVLMNSKAGILFDSQNGSLPVVSSSSLQSLSPDESTEVKIYRSDENRIWYYLIRNISDDLYLWIATPRPRFSLITTLREQLANPMMIAISLGVITALGLSFWLASWMNQPLKNMAGNASVMLTDDSQMLTIEGPQEVKQLATSFNHLIRQVKTARHSQKIFLGNVSHDLKTPITSIQGYSRAMLDGTLQSFEEQNTAARIIFDEASRMQRMVEEMLLLTRLEAGSVPLNKEVISLKPILHSVVEKLLPQAIEKQICIEQFIDSDLPCLADGDKMMQVFTNLIDNAIKYTKAGGRVVIMGKTTRGEHQITFTDSGIGISDHDQKSIFDRFFQADLSRKSGNQHGVGLGLSIVSQLLKMHDGKILLTSKLGEGSTFTVIIPVK